MIPELITAGKYILLIGGSSLTAILLKNWLGKTKEEAEIILDWNKIHKERHEFLLGEIERLQTQVTGFQKIFDEMKEAQSKERLIWQDKFNKQEKYINGLEIEIETLRNGTD